MSDRKVFGRPPASPPPVRCGHVVEEAAERVGVAGGGGGNVLVVGGERAVVGQEVAVWARGDVDVEDVVVGEEAAANDSHRRVIARYKLHLKANSENQVSHFIGSSRVETWCFRAIYGYIESNVCSPAM
jgi:hypothetical protein